MASAKSYMPTHPATGNNGSAFAGLTTNTYWYDTTMGMAMLLGRFFMIIPVLALAGNLAQKKKDRGNLRQLSSQRTYLYRVAGGNGFDRRGTDLFPGLIAGAHGGTLPDDRFEHHLF